MSIFLHNKTSSKVSLIDGKVLLAVGGFAIIAKEQADHPDVLHAQRVGWVTVENSKVSKTPTPDVPTGIKFAEDPMKGSTTIPKQVKKEPEVTATPIGAKQVESEPEATVEADAESSTDDKKKKTVKKTDE